MNSSRDHALTDQRQADLVAQAYVLSRASTDENGCWIWSGADDGHGYGIVRIGRRRLKAHRVSYTAFVGPIPRGLQIDHLCRVRRCCNPAHLEAVTARENVLRGNSPAAKRAAQTHCKHGHEFTAVNTYRDRLGRRVCRACRAALDARRNAVKVPGTNPSYPKGKTQ